MEEALENASPAPADAANDAPSSAGVYRLYRGARLLHVGMAAGAATIRSELARHASGQYGALTQAADRIDWEVAPDDVLAYQRFLALYAAATYAASGSTDESAAPSVSRRYSPGDPD